MGALLIAQVFNGIVYGLILALVAIGLSLTNGLLGIANLIHAGIFTVGGYAGVKVYDLTGNFYLACLTAIIAGVVVGFIVEKLCIKKVYNDTDTSVILTFALLWIVSESLRIFVGPSSVVTNIPKEFGGAFTLGPIISTKYRVIIAIIAIVVVIGFALLMNKTNIGMIARSVLDDRRMTQLFGIQVAPVLTSIYVIASGIAALAGYLGAPIFGVYPNVGMTILVLLLSIVNVGGLGNLWAVVFAAPLVGIIMCVITLFDSSLAYVGVFVFMIISMLIKPEGLFMKKRK